MTTPVDQVARAATIKKLLHKAEAKGTTPEERDAFNAGATRLMIQWGIDQALLAGDTVKAEKIVRRRIELTDVPKSYVYEYVAIGVYVADVLGCSGFFQTRADRRTDLLVVGFEGDVDRVVQLVQSLVVQCTLTLGPWFKRKIADEGDWMSGTDRYQAKRSFIRGFASGVADKLRIVRKSTVDEATTTTPGTDLVLINRDQQIKDWVSSNMKINTSTSGRRYRSSDGFGAGHAAGQRANVGQGTVGGERTAIGG